MSKHLQEFLCQCHYQYFLKINYILPKLFHRGMVIFNFRSIVVVNTELNSTWWTQTFVGEERKIDRDRVGKQERREERKREKMGDRET